jgi:signal transduction histidine kinase
MSSEFIRMRLFRPFATTKAKGLGLGLYQCRSIVRAHGGELAVSSREGEGSEFRMVLPGRRDATAAAPRLEESPAAVGPGRTA